VLLKSVPQPPQKDVPQPQPPLPLVPQPPLAGEHEELLI
jgi:hypothetical protein